MQFNLNSIPIIPFFSLSLFFFLEEKETKIQGNSPTPICPVAPSQNGSPHRIAKISRTITNVCSGL
ncbi:MAG: hypothetical protein V4580_04315 [Bacteroidota bacterium]